MKLLPNFVSIFPILIFSMLPGFAFAWGNQGHHIIASLVAAQLTSKARAEVVRSPVWQTITNIAFMPGSSKLVMTDSEQGHVLTADLPSAGEPLLSHA
jgi:hypothetical protein